MSFHLFVYGTLKESQVFRTVTGLSDLKKERAVLRDYGWVKPIFGYPAISAQPDELVVGELILDVPDEVLHNLDFYELVDEKKLYRREKVKLNVRGQELEAFVYVSNAV